MFCKIWQCDKEAFPNTDEDGTFTQKISNRKGRAIVEVGLDGSYIMSETKAKKERR